MTCCWSPLTMALCAMSKMSLFDNFGWFLILFRSCGGVSSTQSAGLISLSSILVYVFQRWTLLANLSTFYRSSLLLFLLLTFLCPLGLEAISLCLIIDELHASSRIGSQKASCVHLLGHCRHLLSLPHPFLRLSKVLLHLLQSCQSFSCLLPLLLLLSSGLCNLLLGSASITSCLH